MIHREPVEPYALLAVLHRFFGDYFDNACDMICRVNQEEFRMAYADHVVPPVCDDVIDDDDRESLRVEHELDGMGALGELDHILRSPNFIDLSRELEQCLEGATAVPMEFKVSKLPRRLY